MTVGQNLDPLHDPTHRNHYFATLLDWEEDKPLLRNHPDFTLPESFAAALEVEPIGGRLNIGNFLLSPFRWLIHRLVRFPQLLLWPEHKTRALDGFVRSDQEHEEPPQLRAWLEEAGTIPSNADALILDTKASVDCKVLWEVAAQVESGFYNYFIADMQATEVYQLQHHSKVIVSIPESQERQRLLDELSRYPDVLENCSNFISEWDGYKDDES